LRRLVLTHIAFERQTGIGFFEILPRRTGSSAKGALFVFLAIDDVYVSAGALGGRIVSRKYRHIDVPKRLTNHPNARPSWIRGAIFFGGVKGGADHLTGPAAVAFIHVNSYGFDCFLHFSYPSSLSVKIPR
jgi:hypothetical protein